MKSKTLIRIVLLGLVLTGIGRWAWQEFAAPEASTAVAFDSDGIHVLSLHGNQRCRTCIRIGDLTRSEVESRFANAIADGRVHWHSLNYEEPAHRELVHAYQLVSPTVILSQLQDGREVTWVKLDEVWDHVGDEPAFRKFIETQVSEMLDPT